MVCKLLVVLLALGLAGCATTKNQTTQLQTRVGELERQVDQKDEEIKNLKEEVKDLSYSVDRMSVQRKKESRVRSSASSKNMKTEDIIRVGVSVEKVQSALQKAGYYDGAIDGKLGAKTRAAISNFQGDHGLKADGIVGAKTWSELKAAGASRRSTTVSSDESFSAGESSATDSVAE